MRQSENRLGFIDHIKASKNNKIESKQLKTHERPEKDSITISKNGKQTCSRAPRKTENQDNTQ